MEINTFVEITQSWDDAMLTVNVNDCLAPLSMKLKDAEGKPIWDADNFTLPFVKSLRDALNTIDFEGVFNEKAK